MIKMDPVNIVNVSKFFRDKKSGGIITAVDGITLSLKVKTITALVGESGSGKTTLGRITTGLERANKGTVYIEGKEIQKYKSINLWQKVQYTHQDPYSALDPYLKVRDVLERPLKFLLGISDKEQLTEIIENLITKIGMDRTYLDKRNEELSGGERQRILVGRAFIVKPVYVVADEPTTMIDSIHRNVILGIIGDLVKETNAAVMLITHDISVALHMSDNIAIMYNGEIIEKGPTKAVFDEPLHPYTQNLKIASVDNLIKGREVKVDLSKINLFKETKGCKFAKFCQFSFEKCWIEKPSLKEIREDHFVACFLYS